MELAPERRLTAILSADVVGYSRLMAGDEAATVAAIRALREQVEKCAERNRGRLVDFTGDEFMAEFPSSLGAVNAALEIQEELRERDAGLASERRMALRMGLHMGDVRVVEDRLYGDDVNIAARLRELASAGEICISDLVYRHVRNHLDLAYLDLGERSVKNIPDPVRVYRIASPVEGDAAGDPEVIPAFAGRHAIAVLPFLNMSNDPEQEFFADGLVDDLIMRLSSWRSFPVIARTSSQVYKARSVDLGRVSRELGARYVVQGSIRRSGSRVRISTQLVDAITGQQLWADRFDREIGDFFALQDEITEAIVGAIYPEVLQAESARVVRADPESLDAWECVHRGFAHLFETRSSNRIALSFFERAVELDPRFVWGHYGIVITHYNDIIDASTSSVEKSTEAAVGAARRCLNLAEQDALSHVAWAAACILTGRREEALAALDTARELNPSLPRVHQWRGNALALQGRAEESIEAVKQAIRLSPRDPQIFAFYQIIALAHFGVGRYEEAVRWAERSLQRRPDGPAARAILAACLAQSGRLEEAQAAAAALFERRPDLSVASVRPIFSSANPEIAERFFDGLRAVGFKD